MICTALDDGSESVIVWINSLIAKHLPYKVAFSTDMYSAEMRQWLADQLGPECYDYLDSDTMRFDTGCCWTTWGLYCYFADEGNALAFYMRWMGT